MITQQHQDRLVARGRDEMMTAFCKVASPNEAMQRDAAERFTAFMQDLVPEIVGVVAIGDYPAFGVKLDNIDGKGKIALKAVDVDTAGPALITHIGASLTLVLTDPAQFDRKRPAAEIVPDQRPLPLADDEEGDDEGDEENESFDDPSLTAAENGDHVEDVGGIDAAAGPFFSAVEVGASRLPDGTEVQNWVLLHGDTEVHEPLGAVDQIHALADSLNHRAALLGRDLTPFEVRDAVMTTTTWGQALKGAYTTEAIQVASLPQPANDQGEASGAKRGPKTAAEKTDAYFAGFDGAAASLFTEDCPHERGKLREMWLMGLQDAKAGQPARFQRITAAPANDDAAAPAVEVA